MNYYTSDTHFGDKRLNLFPRYFKSSDEMDDFIISKWNDIIRKDDVVYHLGDVLVDESKFKLISKLNGKKHLILGNYDDKFDKQKFIDSGFETVQESIDLTINDLEVHLVHYPSKGVVDKFNLVGHVHGAWRVQKNMLNVGIDVWHYNPITDKDILFFYNAIDKFYDDDIWVAYKECNVKHKSRGKSGEAAKGSLNESIKLKDLIK